MFSLFRPLSLRLQSAVRAQVAAFTLLEICLVVMILALIATLAVPSVTGLLAERRLRASLDALDDLVSAAQHRSIVEGKTHILFWNPGGKRGGIWLCPEEMNTKERAALPSALATGGGSYQITLPATFRADPPPAQWTFWPSGNCEPALVRYSGPAGSWTASYQPLTARSTLLEFHPR